jgi:ABC-type phosphate transport system permease subunit
MLSALIGFAVGGATYAFAKKKQASTGTAAATATAAGVGGMVVGSLVIGAATVVVPLAVAGGVGYWLAKRGNKPRALGPGRP